MYRGWSVTGATVMTQAAQAGLLIYGFSALALPLEREFGTSRAEVMIATTCLSLASSALAPVAGALIDHRSIRGLMLFGCAALAAGFAAISQATALWHVWLAYGLLLPFANVLLGQLTSAALVTRWFEERRGRAMGISTLGTSLGGFVFPVLLATGSAEMGWRIAALTIGLAAAALLAALVAALIADRPPSAHAPATPGANAGGSSRAILASAPFWIITFAVGIKIATYFGLINNLGGLAQDLGFGGLFAATMVSILSIASMVGKLAFGTIAERVAPKWLFMLALAMTVASFGLLLIAQATASLVTVCLLLGLSTGGMFPLWGLITAEYFDSASFGRALGLMNLAMVPLTAIAAPLAGWAHDLTGSYAGAIWGSMVMLVLAILIIGLLRPSGRPTA